MGRIPIQDTPNVPSDNNANSPNTDQKIGFFEKVLEKLPSRIPVPFAVLTIWYMVIVVAFLMILGITLAFFDPVIRYMLVVTFIVITVMYSIMSCIFYINLTSKK